MNDGSNVTVFILSYILWKTQLETSFNLKLKIKFMPQPRFTNFSLLTICFG